MFVWNNSYDVGIAQVDTQHRRLIDLMNELEAAISSGGQRGDLDSVIQELVDYTVYHFSEEEKLLAVCPADFQARHKGEHREFIAKVSEAQGLAAADLALGESLHMFLSQWLISHILGSDKMLAAYFNGHEINHAGNELQALRRQLELSNAERSLLTALRDSEKRFRILTDNTPVLVWMAAENGKRSFFNKRWLDYVGGGLHRQVSGAWADGLHPEDRAAYEAHYNAVVAKPAPAVNEYRLKGRDEQYRWFVEQIAPLYDDELNCVGFIGSAFDISQRKEAEYLLAHTNEELERLVEERTAELRAANRVLIENEKIIRQLMLTDPLTDVANRRCLNERLAQELNRFERYRRPLSLIICDIDFFKRINDTYGHDIGDLVLKAFAATVRGTLRAEDLLGRFGGEEFLIILPETALDKAFEVAERVRAAIAHLELGEVPNGITASFGVAAACAGDTSDEVIKRADGALYQAKHGGRNRVVVAADPTVN